MNLARFHQIIRWEAVFFYELEAALQKTIKLNGTARIESGTPLRENGTVFLKWYTLILP